ncbi:hypothetical protein MHLNE_22820 [Moorella humiferrea]|uniref:ABC transporter substrate-binding protein n=1 Tax=Neomoorella humiferrea TaxID=676965 RepID=UPI0030D2C572
MKKISCLLMLILAFTFLIVGCGTSKTVSEGGNKKGEVKVEIGVIEPLTGSMAPLGNAEFEAIKMAIEMINEKGGVAGKYPISYFSADSQSDPGIGAAEAERLITTKNVPILLGSYSSAIAMAISEVAERNRVVLWEMSGSTDDLLKRGYKWTFRNESMASAWGATSVEFLAENQQQIKEKLGKDLKDLKVAIVHEDGPYGTSVAKGNEVWAKKFGMNIVLNEAYSGKAVDLSSIIMKLKSAKPDVLLLTSYVNDAILFNRQAKELNFTVPILITHSGGHSVQAFVDGVGADANYILTVDPVPTNPNTAAFDLELANLYNEFVKRWTAKFGTPPYHHVEHRQFAQTILLLTKVLPVAIEKAGKLTPDSIAEAIRGLKLSANESLCGYGVEFSTPDKPFQDPWLGNQHIGQNILARAFINQYFDKQLSCVWPENIASKKPVLFLPKEHPIAPK